MFRWVAQHKWQAWRDNIRNVLVRQGYNIYKKPSDPMSQTSFFFACMVFNHHNRVKWWVNGKKHGFYHGFYLDPPSLPNFPGWNASQLGPDDVFIQKLGPNFWQFYSVWGRRSFKTIVSLCFLLLLWSFSRKKDTLFLDTRVVVRFKWLPQICGGCLKVQWAWMGHCFTSTNEILGTHECLCFTMGFRKKNLCLDKLVCIVVFVYL
jgi:hypothetical protein